LPNLISPYRTNLVPSGSPMLSPTQASS
jgi:hypothetical protein